MRIRCGYDIVYGCPAPTPIVLMLDLRPERAADLETPDILTIAPDVPRRRYQDQFGNVCTRIVAPAGEVRFSSSFVVRDSGLADERAPDAKQHRVEDLPDEMILYLMGSRYCETDRLVGEAWRLFGHIPPGWGRVEAIVDFVHNHIRFGYPHARPTRTAHEAYQEGVGVCRDFAHLAVTFCRCMNIPARYCTGYLGDIGIDPIPGPMDFSAWFEAFLGDRWYAFDARHRIPRIGRVCMARGRDAIDTAISTNFGPTWLGRFDVIAELA